MNRRFVYFASVLCALLLYSNLTGWILWNSISPNTFKASGGPNRYHK